MTTDAATPRVTPRRAMCAQTHALGIDEAMSETFLRALEHFDSSPSKEHARATPLGHGVGVPRVGAPRVGPCRALARRASAEPRLERRGPRGTRPSPRQRLLPYRLVERADGKRRVRDVSPRAFGGRFRGRLLARGEGGAVGDVVVRGAQRGRARGAGEDARRGRGREDEIPHRPQGETGVGPRREHRGHLSGAARRPPEHHRVARLGR